MLLLLHNKVKILSSIVGVGYRSWKYWSRIISLNIFKVDMVIMLDFMFSFQYREIDFD